MKDSDEHVLHSGRTKLPWTQWAVPGSILFSLLFALWWAITREPGPAALTALGVVLVFIGLPSLAIASWRWRLTPSSLRVGRLAWPGGILRRESWVGLRMVDRVEVYTGDGKDIAKDVDYQGIHEGQFRTFQRGAVVVGIRSPGGQRRPRLVIGTSTPDEAEELGWTIRNAVDAMDQPG